MAHRALVVIGTPPGTITVAPGRAGERLADIVVVNLAGRPRQAEDRKP